MAEGATERLGRRARDEGPPPVEAPSLEEALGWAGSRLDEVRGGSVGRVEGVYVDAVNGQPHWLLVRMGRFGHHSALPLVHAVGGIRHVWVPYGRDEIRAAPRIDPEKPLTCERELALCRYFGIDDRGGRAGALATRPAQSTTARLADRPTVGARQL